MHKSDQKKHCISLDKDIYNTLISGHIILSECSYFLDKAKLNKEDQYDLYITRDQISELLGAIGDESDNTYPENKSRIGDLENIYVCLRAELWSMSCH